MTGNHDQLDYFGNTVNQVWSLLELSEGGDCVFSEQVAGDGEVGKWMELQASPAEVLEWIFGSNFASRGQRQKLISLSNPE